MDEYTSEMISELMIISSMVIMLLVMITVMFVGAAFIINTIQSIV